MKKKFLWIICLLLIISIGSFSTLAASKEDFEKVVLKNGVTVLYKVMKDQRMVSMYAVFPIGFNGVKARGIPHLLEHLVFRGGSGLHFNDIAGVSTRKGGYFNGFTTFFDTAYNYVVPKEQFENAFNVFNKCIWEINLDPSDVEMEKQIISYELNMGYSSQYQYYPVVHYFYPEMFHSKQTLDPISVQDLKQFHQSYYQPDKATYIIAGDIDPQKVTAQLEQVQNRFGYIKTSELPVADINFPVGEVVEERNLYPYQYQLLMGYRLDGLNPNERMIIKLLSYIYGADYKIDYQKNQYKVYNVITRIVGDLDYFGVYYLERNQMYSEAAVAKEKENLLRFFHEFKKIKFKQEVKNFIRLIELEKRQSRETAEDSVEYEVQRLTSSDSITVDALPILNKLTEKDLLAVIDKYFSKPPTTWIVVKTTK